MCKKSPYCAAKMLGIAKRDKHVERSKSIKTIDEKRVTHLIHSKCEVTILFDVYDRAANLNEITL